MILKISSRGKASVPKTLVKRNLRLHSLYLVQNTHMFTESRGEFSDLHSVFILRALRYSGPGEERKVGNSAYLTTFPDWILLFPHRRAISRPVFPRFIEFLQHGQTAVRGIYTTRTEQKISTFPL